MPDPRKLLIIDDCAEDRRIYRRYLLRDPHESYEILEADSAREGLALYHEMSCDVILLDFCLPDMSGLEILDALKQQKVEIAASVIMLSGRGDEEVAVQAIKKGAQDYLVKQRLQPDALRTAVSNVIKRSELQTQLNKTRERQRLVATTALRIRQSLNLEEILATAVAEIQQLLKCDRVAVYQFAPNVNSNEVNKLVELCTQTPCLWHFLEEQCQGYQKVISKVCEAGSNTSCLNWLETQNDRLGAGDRELLQPQNREREQQGSGTKAVDCSQKRDSPTNLVVPITLTSYEELNSQLWGLLVAHKCLDKRQWQSTEINILNELTVHLAVAIQQAELRAQAQAAILNEKKLNAFKSQIITTVSYQYRTPLASILAAASTLKHYGDKLSESRQTKFLQTIEQKARYMSQLVDDLLLFEKFELSQTKFTPQPINLPQFFSELMEEQRGKVGGDHELIFQISGNCQNFWGDGALLKQIFVSLLSNAIRYSPEGGKIEFHLIGQDSIVIFSVRDEGIGIPLEEQKNLFQLFWRGSNVNTIPGTGLGLAITKACIELHGGNIILESQLGQGTLVTVTLPKKFSLKTGSRGQGLVP